MTTTVVNRFVVAVACVAVSVVTVGPARANGPVARDALVSVGSPRGLHPRNVQNEPALAVDPTRPNVLAVGANDAVDTQPCSQVAATTLGACSVPPPGGGTLGFNLGVGISGVSFSFDAGASWVQPTYTGLTAAGCSPTDEPCTAIVGPIHTVPNYFEAGLRSHGDPAVAFGPKPGDGEFSWTNGSRLYYANNATNLTDTAFGGGVNTGRGVAVSHIDNITADSVLDQTNWSTPQLVVERSARAALLDKPQIWADNAETSPFLGNVYVCYTDFHSGANHQFVATSIDGGATWTKRRIAPPAVNKVAGTRFGCTVRTDSRGVVYAWLSHFAFGTPGIGTHTLVRSFDGGKHWTQPAEVIPMNDACYAVEPIGLRCVADGIAGARTDLAAMPSVDIANGAPTGLDASDEIVVAWSDGRSGLNSEITLVSYSTDHGQTWSEPTVVSQEGHRSIYSAPAISPDGSTIYVVYMALTAPLQNTTANPRPTVGVLRAAPVGADGVPGPWTTLYSGPAGDARGTSLVRMQYNEFLGDYVYAIATRAVRRGVWTDLRHTEHCPAIDAWRQASFDARQPVFPAPWPLGECPTAFGNSDIFSATSG